MRAASVGARSELIAYTGTWIAGRHGRSDRATAASACWRSPPPAARATCRRRPSAPVRRWRRLRNSEVVTSLRGRADEVGAERRQAPLYVRRAAAAAAPTERSASTAITPMTRDAEQRRGGERHGGTHGVPDQHQLAGWGSRAPRRPRPARSWRSTSRCDCCPRRRDRRDSSPRPCSASLSASSCAFQ